MSLQAVLDYVSVSSLEKSIAIGWNPVCHITYDRDTWVKLVQPPSVYAFDQAKLICQASSTTWIAWVPDHGEVTLDRSDFYC